MVRLVPLRLYDDLESRPVETFLTPWWCARYTLAEELTEKDRWKGNRTAFRLARGRLPRCVKCGHGARMWPLVHLDAYQCRWGHTTSGLELHAMRRARA